MLVSVPVRPVTVSDRSLERVSQRNGSRVLAGFGCLAWVVLAWRRPGLGSGETGSEAGVGGGEVVAPRPGAVDPEDCLPSSGDEAGGDVEEPVAQALGFGIGGVALEVRHLVAGRLPAAERSRLTPGPDRP